MPSMLLLFWMLVYIVYRATLVSTFVCLVQAWPVGHFSSSLCRVCCHRETWMQGVPEQTTTTYIYIYIYKYIYEEGDMKFDGLVPS